MPLPAEPQAFGKPDEAGQLGPIILSRLGCSLGQCTCAAELFGLLRLAQSAARSSSTPAPADGPGQSSEGREQVSFHLQSRIRS